MIKTSEERARELMGRLYPESNTNYVKGFIAEITRVIDSAVREREDEIERLRKELLLWSDLPKAVLDLRSKLTEAEKRVKMLKVDSALWRRSAEKYQRKQSSMADSVVELEAKLKQYEILGSLMIDNTTTVFERIKELEAKLKEAMKTIYRCTCQNNGGGS